MKDSKKLNLNCLYALLLVLFISCESKNTLPDPLEAGWKGRAVCEIMEENNELRVLKCTF
jgi:hypothetical protein